MNTAISPLKIEHHELILKYEHIRLAARQRVDALVNSIRQQGQIVPVCVIAAPSNAGFILMDGYLRVKALSHLGQDTLDAHLWPYDEQAALVNLLLHHQARAWDALEEALLLREIQQHNNHALSQQSLAHSMGRDKSWVSRRLSLLEGLSESLLQAILNGTCSHWAVSRVLLPLARANSAHAECLLAYLSKTHCSTRELSHFYQQYSQANKPQRDAMVNQPDLFFKARALFKAEQAGAVLKEGPEGEWEQSLKAIQSHITRLKKLVPIVLHEHQEPQDKAHYLGRLTQVWQQFNELTQPIRML